MWMCLSLLSYTHTNPSLTHSHYSYYRYNSPMDYGDNTMTEAVNIEKIFTE